MCPLNCTQLLWLFWLVYLCHTKLITIPGNSSVINQTTNTGPKEREYADPTVEAFEACGLIKRCFSRYVDPATDLNCIEDRRCDMIFAFGKGLGENPKPDEAIFEIYAVARGWAAVGISNDDRMGEDYVVECSKEGNIVKIHNSWNTKIDGANTNIRLRGDQNAKGNIRPIKALFFEDKLYCKFYIKMNFSKIAPDGKEHDFDLLKPYFYLMAFSNSLPETYDEETGNLGPHLAQGAVSERGRKKEVGGERFSPLPHQAKHLRIHGIFMVLCWLFFLSLSIFIARYLKETMTRIRIWSMELWHFAHALTATLALPCILVSIVFHATAHHGWQNLYRSNFHTYSGIVCLCLFITELVSGIFARKSVEGKTNMLNMFHVIVGHVTYALSLLNMIYADRVAYGFLACNFTTYVIAWSVLYTIIHFLMTYHKCWAHFVLGKGYLSEGITAHGIVEANQPEAVVIRKGRRSRKSRASVHRHRGTFVDHHHHHHHHELIIEAPGRYFRLWSLGMFSVFTIFYTFWACRKLLTYPRHCYNFTTLKFLETKGSS